MLQEFHSEDEEASKKRPTTNLDYSFGRCKTERLQEQMSAEKVYKNCSKWDKEVIKK